MAKKRRTTKPPPRCKAILLCQHVIFDQFTETITLVGIVSELSVEALPGYTPPTCVFLQLVDGIGRYDLGIEIHDLQNNAVVAAWDHSGILEFGDRPNQSDVLFRVPPLLMEHEGSYDLIVFASGEEIDRTKFSIVEKDDENEQESADESESN